MNYCSLKNEKNKIKLYYESIGMFNPHYPI